MPTYEYKCSKCEEVFEFFQRISDEPMKTCPVCSGELNRLISGGMGVIFKGSGFYTTDNKNNAHKTYDSSNKKTDAETSSSSETKSSEPKKEPTKSPDKKTEAAK